MSNHFYRTVCITLANFLVHLELLDEARQKYPQCISLDQQVHAAQ